MVTSVQVLHVDDEPQFGELVSELLQREGDSIDVHTESTPTAGLGFLDRHDRAVDCVVSDYKFLDVVRESYPDLPFILFTGKGSEEVASEAISRGVTDYMQKERGTDQYAVLANRIENAVDRYRTQQDARRTQQRLEELTESSVDCRWMFDSEWEELLFISGYEEVWNRSAEAIEANPRDFLNGVHPEHRQYVREAMDRLSAGESIDIEYRILRGGDEPGWVWVKGEPVRDDSGAVVRIVGFTRDVTARKRREKELREEREFINHALNTLDDVFYVVGTDGKLRRWNDRLVELTGYAAAEIAEMAAVELFRPEDHERIEAAIEETLTTGETTVEAAFLSADGEQIPHEFTGSRFTDTDGEVIGLVGVGREISKHRRLE